ncbi:MAG: tetratricopeptide repeat protein, partial [Verrucomicrobia bacterium]|nr:tetratricopeptide repeat protein [Verrucomicrobiota bacterium]
MVTTKKIFRGAALQFAALWGAVWLAGCSPSGPQALREGDRLVSEGKFAEAVAPLRIAVEKLPKEARAWNHLGLALHQSGSVKDAERAYRQALALDNNLLQARFNLGCLLLEQNLPGAAQ